MSSHYTILCVSHDPAIVVGWDENWRDPAPALEAVRDRSEGPAQLHGNCDLLVGRYSYPLVEVCCPRTRAAGLEHYGHHPHEDKWIADGWLRLLALADVPASSTRRTDCWSRATALKLRFELGIEEEKATS